MGDMSLMQAAIDKLVTNSSMPTLRVFSGSMKNIVENLNGYGCWCYFYEDVGRGKGQPVDEMDGICKTLHEGYECAIRDSEDQGIQCTPWEQPYVGGTNQPDGVASACQRLNSGDPCATYSCIA